jgi:hypothetical protein
MLTVVARKIDDGDRNARAFGNYAAHGEAVVRAAVIDQHDLVPAGDPQPFERGDDLADAVSPAIDRDDDIDRDGSRKRERPMR